MDVFPLPQVDDTLDMLSQTQYFSMQLGTGKSRWTRPLKRTLLFNTHSGHYEFCVMPFGLCNGPVTFQRLMESILVGCQGVAAWCI